MHMSRSGHRLGRHVWSPEDEFGGLSQLSHEPGEWISFEIDLETYQREVDGQPFNRT